MTTNEVIAELQRVVLEQPEKGEMPCCVYAMSYAGDPEHVSMIDGTISDRVDINGTEDI